MKMIKLFRVNIFMPVTKFPQGSHQVTWTQKRVTKKRESEFLISKSLNMNS